MNIDFIIKGNNILLPSGVVGGLILIKGRKIADVIRNPDYSIDAEINDVEDLFVIPGVIDPHVHINEPGRTEWEGFDTATKAAAAGGVTTVVDMPLNSTPVTTSVKNLQLKLQATEKQLHVNCGFWGGVVPGNTKELEPLLEAGALGLKAFLTHSGIDDFPETHREDLRKALLILKSYKRPLLVHCELDKVHEDQKLLNDNPRNYISYLKSRPKSWEDSAIAMMIELCRETDSHVHIVHLSSADSLEQIRAAKKSGLPLTVETGQHYLFFNAEEIPEGATQYKCAPPIREKNNNEKLWQALIDGTIDFIATDHSPAPPELKEIDSGDFRKAWGGISGLQFALSSVLTRSKEKKINIETVSKWLTQNPSKFLQMDSIKGMIGKGFDADLTVVNPDAEFTVDESKICHRHKITPYSGQKFKGVIKQTYVNGIKVYDTSKFINLNAGNIVLS